MLKCRLFCFFLTFIITVVRYVSPEKGVIKRRVAITMSTLFYTRLTLLIRGGSFKQWLPTMHRRCQCTYSGGTYSSKTWCTDFTFPIFRAVSPVYNVNALAYGYNSPFNLTTSFGIILFLVDNWRHRKYQQPRLVILSQWAWFSLSTRSFIGSNQNSNHPLLKRGG